MKSEQVGIWKEVGVPLSSSTQHLPGLGKAEQNLSLQLENGRDRHQTGLYAECQSTNAVSTRSLVVKTNNLRVLLTFLAGNTALWCCTAECQSVGVLVTVQTVSTFLWGRSGPLEHPTTTNTELCK